MPIPYSHNTTQYAALIEEINPEEAYANWLHLIPSPGIRVLDVGAGSGRDAAWLVSKGYHVIAAEPSDAMRSRAMDLHPGLPIRWIKDSLPLLNIVSALNEKFDFILANAVWIHVPPQEQDQAMKSLAALLETNGILAITLRHGPSPDDRVMHPCSRDSLADLAEKQRLDTLMALDLPDFLGRDEISWTHMVFQKRF